jgi:predicted CoA-binding protein
MDTAEHILREFGRIAVVGISEDPSRPSCGVSKYMHEQGYTILPVNPKLDAWNGLPAYPDLASVPKPIEVVDIFRRSELVGPVVEEAIRAGAKAIWMQEGVVNDEAARAAADAGLLVVMDRCILKEHRARGIGPRSR